MLKNRDVVFSSLIFLFWCCISFLLQILLSCKLFRLMSHTYFSSLEWRCFHFYFIPKYQLFFSLFAPFWFGYLFIGHQTSMKWFKILPLDWNALAALCFTNCFYLIADISWREVILLNIYACSQVYMDREIKSGEIVALKKIRMDNEREGVYLWPCCWMFLDIYGSDSSSDKERGELLWIMIAQVRERKAYSQW